MKQVVCNGDFEDRIYEAKAFMKYHAVEPQDVEIVWTDSDGKTTITKFEEEPGEDEIAKGFVTIGDLMNGILEAVPQRVALRHGGVELVIIDLEKEKAQMP